MCEWFTVGAIVSTPPTPPTNNISLLSDGRHGKYLVRMVGGYDIPGRSVDVAREKQNQHITTTAAAVAATSKCQKDTGNPQPKGTRYQVRSVTING